MATTQKQKTILYVIFAAPEPRSGLGAHYIAKDGSISRIKRQAATFVTFGSAERFAKEKGIALSAAVCIGQLGFMESERQGFGDLPPLQGLES